ncbi:MAG: hypothetical protein ACLU7P_06690 [Eggerthella lenta]
MPGTTARASLEEAGHRPASTLPTIHGETVVIRLLDKSEALTGGHRPGGRQLEKYQRLIGSNNGMVLIVEAPPARAKAPPCTMIR